MATVKVKRGDIGKVFSEVIYLENRDAAPTAPTTALFLMRKDATLISKTATVGAITYDAGTRVASIPISYTTVTGDLAIALGLWKQEWEMTWTGGALITFPDDNTWNYVLVGQDLNPPA